MAEPIPPITVQTPAAATTITTTVTRRRPIKLLVLNIVNGVLSTLLAVLAYLQTINLNGVLTPEKALLWIVGVNVANIVIRQWFSPSETVQTTMTPVDPTKGAQS